MVEVKTQGDKIKKAQWDQIKEGLQVQTKEFRLGSEGDRASLQVLQRYDTGKGVLGDALCIQF